jgi:hypothetical protein
MDNNSLVCFNIAKVWLFICMLYVSHIYEAMMPGRAVYVYIPHVIL